MKVTSSAVTVSVPVLVTRVKASTALLVLSAATFLLAGEVPSPMVVVTPAGGVKSTVSFGLSARVPYSLDLKSTPPEPVSVRTHPSFASPSDQFWRVVVTVTFLVPVVPALIVPIAVA
ncbi:hypothetical protein ES707_18783 [subsurface metagenome]